MATAYAELTQKVTDQVVSGIDQVREATVSTVGEFTRIVGDLVPALPDMPYADQLPTPHEALEAGFDNAARVLDAVKRFWLDLADAYVPARKPA